jgi:hypothetical protein
MLRALQDVQDGDKRDRDHGTDDPGDFGAGKNADDFC